MRTWIVRGVLALSALVLLAGVITGVGSEAIIAWRHPTPLPQVRATTDPGAIPRGAHLAQLYGCNGCHEPNLQGELFYDAPMVATVWTSNLTRAMPHYTDAELARAIRGGVRPDGSSLMGMPSESWAAVTDAEMGDLLAWLRTHPPAGPVHPRVRMGLMGRIGVLTGQFKPTPVYVAEDAGNTPLDLGPTYAVARHMAQTVCSECHGADLTGRPGDTPDLMMAASYDLAGFTRLMRTGIAADGKKRGLMTEVSRGRFSHFSDAEIADLHAYLTARAQAAD